MDQIFDIKQEIDLHKERIQRAPEWKEIFPYPEKTPLWQGRSLSEMATEELIEALAGLVKIVVDERRNNDPCGWGEECQALEEKVYRSRRLKTLRMSHEKETQPDFLLSKPLRRDGEKRRRTVFQFADVYIPWGRKNLARKVSLRFRRCTI